MRKRLITAAVGLPLLVAVLFLYNTIALNAAVALISFVAIYEVLITTKYVHHRFLFAICAVFAVTVPFFHLHYFHLAGGILCFLFLVMLFVFSLAHHKQVPFQLIGTVCMMTLLLSFSLSCIVFVRDYFAGDIAINKGLFYIILIFTGAWVTDAGAYFVGRFLGKHKLAPEISPKKTVEGAVGGVVCTLLFFLLEAFLYGVYCRSVGEVISVHYVRVAVAAVLCSAAAILGDLSASIIKRECSIKDFGNIMPGHGGVLDRFDSILFVAPLIYFLMQILPVV